MNIIGPTLTTLSKVFLLLCLHVYAHVNLLVCLSYVYIKETETSLCWIFND